jgi:hypothetical protein
MQANEKPGFLKVMNGMAAMRKATLVPEVLDLWWMCMADWALADFQAAAVQVLKTTTFMPQPKDFEDLRKSGRETGGEAFANCRQWLKYSPYGYTLLPETPRKIAACIAAIGGPDELAMCDVDKRHFLERRFCEHYEEIGDRMDSRDAVPQIAFHEDRPRIAGTFKSLTRQPEKA